MPLDLQSIHTMQGLHTFTPTLTIVSTVAIIPEALSSSNLITTNQ